MDINEIIAEATKEASERHEATLEARWKSYRGLLEMFADVDVDIAKKDPEVSKAGCGARGEVTFIVGDSMLQVICEEGGYLVNDDYKRTLTSLDKACEVIAQWVGVNRHVAELKAEAKRRQDHRETGLAERPTVRSVEEAKEFFLANSCVTSGSVRCLHETGKTSTSTMADCFQEAVQFFGRQEKKG